MNVFDFIFDSQLLQKPDNGIRPRPFEAAISMVSDQAKSYLPIYHDFLTHGNCEHYSVYIKEDPRRGLSARNNAGRVIPLRQLTILFEELYESIID